ncbi:MAG: PilZ domain-containing protein [Desulfocapsa sp.]|nr:PilZ domain-containing protein [Desulfocapsa sp.]
MSGNNSRQHERFSIRIKTKVSAETLSGKTPMMEFKTANISSGGAFIETDTPLPLVSKVRLEFLLSLEDIQSLKFVLSLETLKSWTGNRLWVSATGVVMRCQSDGMGIMFDENYKISAMSTPEEVKGL